MKRRALLLSAGLLTTLALILLALSFATATPEPVEAPVLSKYEQGPPTADEILELVNQERARVGVKPLLRDERLDTGAQMKADYMAENNVFSHYIIGTKWVGTPEMDEYRAHCTYSSENIQWTPIEDATSEAAMNWWRNSKPHFDAIKDPKYTTTGIAAVYDQDQRLYYSVQHFCVN